MRGNAYGESANRGALMKSSVLLILAATASMTAMTAQADQLPHRKPGLWVSTMTMPGVPMPPGANTSKNCVDAATESAMMQAGQAATKNACSQNFIHMSGNTATMDTVCKFGRMSQTSHAVITYAGDSAYHMEVHAQMSPPMMGRSDSVTSIDAKWQGPCPAGMKPGDIELANGMRMHVSPPGAK